MSYLARVSKVDSFLNKANELLMEQGSTIPSIQSLPRHLGGRDGLPSYTGDASRHGSVLSEAYDDTRDVTESDADLRFDVEDDSDIPTIHDAVDEEDIVDTLDQGEEEDGSDG